MKRNRLSSLGLAIAMALVVVGCTPITKANAADAAAVVGLGTDGSYGAESKSILAKTIIDNRAVFEEAQSKAVAFTDFSASYGGGSVTFTAVAASSLPDSAQDSDFTPELTCSITYKNVQVTHDGKEYELNGTIYARLVVSGLYLSFVLTGGVDIAGAIDDRADIDVLFTGSLAGYAFSGTVNGYSVNSSLTVD